MVIALMGRMAISLKIRRLVQLKRLDVMRIFDAVAAAFFISGKTPAFGCSRAQNSIRPIVDSFRLWTTFFGVSYCFVSTLVVAGPMDSLEVDP